MAKRLYCANPGGRGLRPVELISDRAKRYRANAPENRPPGPKKCIVCRSRRNVEVMHLNGDESDGSRSNLEWGCRSCNTRLGAAFKRLGLGRRTRQMNSAGGAETLGAWIHAITVAKGDQPGDLASAVELIRNTSHAKRRQLQSQAWAARKRKYGSSGRLAFGGDEVPF